MSGVRADLDKPEAPGVLDRRGARATLALALCAVAALWMACAQPAGTAEGGSYEKELEEWKAQRLASLKSEDGWLTLTGLFWLKEGENRLGSDPSNDVTFPEGKAPAFAGTIRLERGTLRLEAAQGSGITSEGRPVSSLELKTDAEGHPTPLELGTLKFHVIKRGEEFAVRVRDTQSPARASFKGIEYYPVERNWIITARFEPYDPPRPLPIANVTGRETQETSPGALSFEVAGRSYRLDPIGEKGSDKLFIIFADETSGKETYGAGRYLYADPPDSSGRVTLDFNRAYSPPCAFTPYATCPLPPPQNRLALRVEAGEKYSDH